MALQIFRRQQPGPCSQSKRAQGIVGKGLSEPGVPLATLLATLLVPLDLPGKQTRGLVSSRVRFFEGEGQGPADGGTAALPVNPYAPTF